MYLGMSRILTISAAMQQTVELCNRRVVRY